MPNYVLGRTYTLRSLQGHIINFNKGEPVWVAPECEVEALQIGAEPVDGKKEVLDVLDPEKPVVEPLSPEERKAKMFDAFAVLEARKTRGDFTAQGIPNVKALEKLVGFDVENKERDKLWREYKTGETE